MAGRYTVHQGNGRCVLFHARLGDGIEENVRTFREKKGKKRKEKKDCITPRLFLLLLSRCIMIIIVGDSAAAERGTKSKR